METFFISKYKLTALLVFLTLSGNGFCVSHSNKTFDIFSLNKLLAKTINIGYTIEANCGNHVHDLSITDLTKIKQAGFTAVRLPIGWVTAMAGDSSFTVDPEFLKKIDLLVKSAVQLHLAVIIDNQADEQLMNQPEQFKTRFLLLWRQLSMHYKAYPQQVMFEIMAEPHGNLEKFWNIYLRYALTIVR
ncbi:MAG: cellulase family glycosylhydrolase, partial [Mucilaginibacter sp.]